MVKANKQNHLAPSHHIAKEWGWFMVMGLILLILGIIASFILPFATTAAAIYIGIMMIVAGITQIIHAFGVKDVGRLIYWLIAGVIYVVSGMICLFQPIFAAIAITFIIGLLLVVAGVIRILGGFRHHGHKGYGWLIAAGFISVIAGILITLGWPENSLWVLGMFVAIDLIIQGWSFIVFSLNLRSHNYNEDEYHNTISENSPIMPVKTTRKTMAKTVAASKKVSSNKSPHKANLKNFAEKIVGDIDDGFETTVNKTKKTIKNAGQTAHSTMRNMGTDIKQAAHKVENTVKKTADKADTEVKMTAHKLSTVAKSKAPLEKKATSMAKTMNQAAKTKPKVK